jgi:16S rRNA (guanine527-N7)-methyltransferase
MFSPQHIDQFKDICSSFGVNLSNEMVGKFQDYTNLIIDWNKRIHLVSKGDARKDRIIRHFVDSLTIFKAVNIQQRAMIIDIGSGAGFPAIPIKIVRDDVKMTLVESVHKKILFLQKGIDVLKLNSLELFEGRAEDLVEQNDYIGVSELVTLRAVGMLKKNVPLGLRFLKTGGLLVIYGGRERDEEIQKLGLLEEFRFKGAVDVIERSFDINRHLVLIEKVNISDEI